MYVSVWSWVSFFLFFQIGVGAVQAQSVGPDDPIRVPKPFLHRHLSAMGNMRMLDVLKVIYPNLSVILDDRPGEGPLLRDIQVAKGPFVSMDSKGTRPGPGAIALLVVLQHALEYDGNDTELFPSLAVVGTNHTRPYLLAKMELTDFGITIDSEHDGGSGLKLDTWQVHPAAKGIVVTVLRSEAGADMNNATAELSMYFVQTNGLLAEVYQTDVLDQTDERTGEMTYSEQMRVKTSINKSDLFNGLRTLDVENYSSRSEDGKLRHVEIDYESLCWNGDSFYDSCDFSNQRPRPVKIPRKIPMRVNSVQQVEKN